MTPEMHARFLQLLELLANKRLAGKLYTEQRELCSNAMTLSRWRRRLLVPVADIAESIVRWAAEQVFPGEGSPTERVREEFIASFHRGDSWAAVVKPLLELPNDLKALRGSLNQTEAALRVGVSRQIYNEWERGWGTPAQVERARWALRKQS